MKNKGTENKRVMINNPSPKDVYYKRLKRIEEAQASIDTTYLKSSECKSNQSVHEKLKDVKQQPKYEKEKNFHVTTRLETRLWLFWGSFTMSTIASSLYSRELFFLSYLCSLIACYLFLRMFFLEIGKNLRQQRRLRASRIILYTIFMGAQIVAICAYYIGDYYKIGENEILYILYHTEDAILASVLMIIVLVLWILAIILAILNKIMVNVHNQD